MAHHGSFEVAPLGAQSTSKDQEEVIAQKENKSREYIYEGPDGINQKQSLINVEDLLSRLLGFFSTASNETLGACVVVLSTSTYIVLGRIGLILLGVLGGIVLHATWDERRQTTTDGLVTESTTGEQKIRGLKIVERLLDWRERERSYKTHETSGSNNHSSENRVSKELDFTDYEPAIGGALSDLIEAVIQDYVK